MGNHAGEVLLGLLMTACFVELWRKIGRIVRKPRKELAMGFEQEIRSKGFDVEREPMRWFYISFVNRSGAFMGAALVQGGNRVEAVFDSVSLQLPEGAKMGTDIEIPADKVPAKEFCNRMLSRAEIQALWPGVSEGGKNGI